MIKVSYAILTHNEASYIDNLFSLLYTHKRPQDEIVVVDDFSSCPHTTQILHKWSSNRKIKLHSRVFDGDHTQKNYLNSLCSGDYIVQLDADETLQPDFISILPSFLQQNEEIDVFFVPRTNKVEGLTQELIAKWQWSVDQAGRINFPDWQMRIYRNCDYVRWDGLLHSRIIGHKTYSYLPTDELFCIVHNKIVDRQIEQNNLYSKIEQTGRTKYKV